jgi:hypothetical protein
MAFFGPRAAIAQPFESSVTLVADELLRRKLIKKNENIGPCRKASTFGGMVA